MTMKKVLIPVLLVVLLFSSVSCNNQPVAVSESDSINMDSDYSIEKHLAGSWTSTDGTSCTLNFNKEDMTATWNIGSYTYSGTYRVSGRSICLNTFSKATAPTLFVHELTSTTLNISGVGYAPISVKYTTFTKN